MAPVQDLQSWKSWLSMLALAGVVGMLGGCAGQQVKYVAVPSVPDAPATPVLAQCANHAARAQREAFGEAFRALQFNASGLVLTTPRQAVGNQQIGAIYDGNGLWYGRPAGTMGEQRAVRFHCMVSPMGNVVYSFIRSE